MAWLDSTREKRRPITDVIVEGRLSDLFESVEPGKKLYVEYHHDTPVAQGKDNVMVYLHKPI